LQSTFLLLSVAFLCPHTSAVDQHAILHNVKAWDGLDNNSNKLIITIYYVLMYSVVGYSPEPLSGLVINYIYTDVIIQLLSTFKLLLLRTHANQFWDRTLTWGSDPWRCQKLIFDVVQRLASAHPNGEKLSSVKAIHMGRKNGCSKGCNPHRLLLGG